MATLNLHRIVEGLRALGIAAEVAHTGGGVATIHAGVLFVDIDDEWRYLILAGPGRFTDGGGAEADPADFHIGYETGAPADDIAVPAVTTDEQAVELIAAVLASPPCEPFTPAGTRRQGQG